MKILKSIGLFMFMLLILFTIYFVGYGRQKSKVDISNKRFNEYEESSKEVEVTVSDISVKETESDSDKESQQEVGTVNFNTNNKLSDNVSKIVVAFTILEEYRDRAVSTVLDYSNYHTAVFISGADVNRDDEAFVAFTVYDKTDDTFKDYQLDMVDNATVKADGNPNVIIEDRDNIIDYNK